MISWYDDIISLTLAELLTKSVWIFPGVPLTFSGAAGNIQGNVDRNLDIWLSVGLMEISRVILTGMFCLKAYIFPSFPVSNELVQPFLEQMTLQEALSKKRIFIVDLTFLENVTVDHPDKFQVWFLFGYNPIWYVITHCTIHRWVGVGVEVSFKVRIVGHTN